MAQKIALLDGYSLMYRAYHALQTPMTAPDGTPTNAVHGFMMMVLKIVEEERPDMLAVAFDVHAKTFRNDRYEAYKANRAPMPGFCMKYTAPVTARKAAATASHKKLNCSMWLN